MVAYAFNFIAWGAEAGRSLSSKFKTSLVYRKSSRIAKAAQRNTVLGGWRGRETKTKTQNPVYIAYAACILLDE